MEKGNNKYLYYTIIAGCIICMVAVFFNVFTDMELPGRIMAAILGVVITATITQLLLQGQTQKEAKLRKTSKVFEEKLRIYQNFLNVLYQAVKDRALSDSEKLELQFQTSLVAMHCDPENINTVSEAVMGVIKNTCNDSPKKQSINNAELLNCLFEVVGAFRKDLYGKDVEWFANSAQQQSKEAKENQSQRENIEVTVEDSKDKKKLGKENVIENFTSAFDAATERDDIPEPPQKLSVDLSMVSDQLKQITSAMLNSQTSIQTDKSVELQVEAVNIEKWKTVKAEWEKNGWKVTGPEDGDGCWLKITTDDNPAVIKVGLCNGCYSLQAEYENNKEFSQGLKNANGGWRSRGEWWSYLPEPYSNVQVGKLTELFNTDNKFQEYLIGRISYLQDVVSKYNRTTQWKNALGNFDSWTYSIYDWTVLVCQSEKAGRQYLDIVPVKDSVEFRLGNRDRNMEMLNKTLDKLDKSGVKVIGNVNKKDCWACVAKIESHEANEIAKKSKELMQKLSAIA